MFPSEYLIVSSVSSTILTIIVVGSLVSNSKYDTKDNIVDDLISIGTIGLIKGIDSFKNDKNTRLTTYCAKCIQNEILMYFRNNKKHINDVSLNDSIGYDKDGNEINLIDVIKSDEEDILTKFHNKDSVETLI